MTDPRFWLWWLVAFLVVVALLSLAAWWSEYRTWANGPAPGLPPAYGPHGWRDWQRKTMEKFRTSWCRRLLRWCARNPADAVAAGLVVLAIILVCLVLWTVADPHFLSGGARVAF